MKHATINTIVKDAVLAAMTEALHALREASECGVRYAETTAAENVDPLKRAADAVRLDQHDPLTHLRIGHVVVALEDIAPHMAQSSRMRATADRLRVAALLLFSARRAADLEARLRDILDHADSLTTYDATTYPALNAIRKLARA